MVNILSFTEPCDPRCYSIKKFMESVDVDRDVSKTDIIEVEKTEWQSLNEVYPKNGSDRSLSATAEILIKTQNDVTLRPMGRLIPGFINPEEGSANETDCSAPPFKQRFRNLQPLTEAVELTNRVAALTRTIREEDDLYLDLEKKNESDLSTKNSSRILNSSSNPRHRGDQRRDARARRRERLNSDSSMSMSHRQLTSNRQIYSSGLSSPEPITLKEIRGDPDERIRQLSSSFVEDHFGVEDDSMLDMTREVVLQNPSTDHRFGIDEEAMNIDGNLHSVAKPSLTSSFIATNCPFVTRKKTPMKFGGYRPASRLIYRNLSSDSESDAALDRLTRKRSSNRIFRCSDADNLVIRNSEFAWSNSYCSTPERVMKVESFPVEKLETLEDEVFSPSRSTESMISFKSTPEPHIPKESRWEAIGDTGNLEGDIENLFDEKKDIHVRESPTLNSKLRNKSYESFSTQELTAISNSFRDGNLIVRPEIPDLEIESQDHSQSHSPSPEHQVETITSSLDVNALIRALSSVSLKQEELTNRKSHSTIQEKSTLGYVNRFSGSSGPRSSEYTPAADPGSRQSLTSVEVSEAHNLIKTSKMDSKAPGQSSPSLKLSERKTRSSSLTPEVREVFSRRSSPGLKKSPVIDSVQIGDLQPEIDPVHASNFIPVVAKVDRTNLVCPKHPLKVKSIGKLIPPRKYPSTNFNEEIDNKRLTSRTTMSLSSEESRRNFSSSKSIPRVTKVHMKKISGLQRKTDNLSLSAPMSGRRVLEPLNLVPKVQESLLNNLNMKFERRRKIANELNEIINSEYDTVGDSSSKIIPDKSFPKKSSLARTRRTESFNSSSGQRPKKKPITRDEKNSSDLRGKSSSPNKEVFSNMTTVKEPRPLVKKRRPLAEKQNQKLMRNFFREEKASALSEEKQSFNISDNKNRVDLNYDLQNEEEVPPITCRDSEYEENSFKEIDIFKQLPNVICASLTRHSSFKTQLIENLNDNSEITNAIKDLKKNIQEDDHRLIKHSKPYDGFQNSTSECLDFSKDNSRTKYAVDNKYNLDKVSSSKSLTNFKSVAHCHSRSSFPNQTKIPVKIPLTALNTYPQNSFEVEENLSSGTAISSDKIYLSSTFYRQESPHESPEAGHLDSQSSSLAHSSSNSDQNTDRSTAESTASISVSKFDKTAGEEGPDEYLAGKVIERNEIVSSGFEEDLQTGNSDTGVISSVNMKDTKSQECIHNTQLYSADTNELVIETVIDEEKCSLNSSEIIEGTPNTENAVKSLTSVAEEFPSCLTVGEQQMAKVLDDEKGHLMNEDNQPENMDSMNFGDSGVGICEKRSSPSSTGSKKSQPNLNEKSFSSTSKWDVTVVNTLRKSQDRFPFTISESASRKTSKFKVVADMSLDEVLQEETGQRILAKSGDQGSSPTETDLVEMDPYSHEDPVLFLEKFASKIADDSLASNRNYEAPMTKLNYVLYGCKEEPRTLIPAVKGMVKKFSARLSCPKTKRQQDTEKTRVKILYRNKKCQGESIEDSSSASSLHHSEHIYNKLIPTSIRGSTDGSRGSLSGKAVKPKRSNACIGASLDHTPRKSRDRNDLWVQEFDSDVEFENVVGHEKMEANLGEKNRYSMFFAKCKTSGNLNEIVNERTKEKDSALKYSEYIVASNIVSKRQGDMDETDSRCPKTPANSYENEFHIREKELSKLNDSSIESGCCCLRICNFFTYSLPGEVKSTGLCSTKKRRRITFWNKKK